MIPLWIMNVTNLDTLVIISLTVVIPLRIVTIITKRDWNILHFTVVIPLRIVSTTSFRGLLKQHE